MTGLLFFLAVYLGIGLVLAVLLSVWVKGWGEPMPMSLYLGTVFLWLPALALRDKRGFRF